DYRPSLYDALSSSSGTSDILFSFPTRRSSDLGRGVAAYCAAGMTQRLEIHPTNPQRRLLFRAAEALRDGGLVAMPTDACYVLACRLGDREAVERLRAIRGLDARHLLTLMCRDLSELSTYARVDNSQYRFLREWTPGPYTFVLDATREVPRRLWHPSRKTIGLRVPDSPIAQGVLEAHGEPVLCSSLILPGEDDPLNES